MSRLLRHSPSPGDTSACFSPPVQFPGRRTLVEFLQHPRQSDWAKQSDARPSTGASSPGSPVSPYTRLGVELDRPSGNPICVFFHDKVSLSVNLCLPFDRALCQALLAALLPTLGRICPRVQSYVVLPQAGSVHISVSTWYLPSGRMWPP